MNKVGGAMSAVFEPGSLTRRVEHHLRYTLARRPDDIGRADINQALALAVREQVVDRLLATEDRYDQAGAKRAYYLSIEFLVGRVLDNALVNLGLTEEAEAICVRHGLTLEAVATAESDPALGNGGLGRLAACILDSMASHDLPGHGYGICYEFGLFRQTFEHGHQVEHADRWLDTGAPWLIDRGAEALAIPIFGRLENGLHGEPRWVDQDVLVGVPHDLPIVGYGGHTVNRLRLFSARSSDDFDVALFNRGDYVQAMEGKIASERISKLLYPEDSVTSGKELRLIQEYFFVACALRDIVAIFKRRHDDFAELPDFAAIQMNDTHPALAVPELMRILIDDEGLGFDEAWAITGKTLAYTNHTLLPEALVAWPVDLLGRVVPRHLDLIYAINQHFLDAVTARYPGDVDRLARMSLVEEHSSRAIRMAHLAMLGSHSVNGVAEAHTALIRTTFGRDFDAFFPDRFNNKTNGVTQRRWLLKANPGLARLISARIGDGWILDLDRLEDLLPHAGDGDLIASLASVKAENKLRLAEEVRALTGVTVDAASMFDVHAKRLHEYKRQLLNCLQAIDDYFSIVEDGRLPKVARTVLFAGKAAPGYRMAKLIIRLINGVAERVNGDVRASDFLKIVFLPDYRVSLAELLLPAADLSEQISTAGFEASGTGNMKLAMNGALTIGTLDGANLEIDAAVGRDNIYIFGLTIPEARQLTASGHYRSRDIHAAEPRIRRVMEALAGDLFAPGEPGLYLPIVRALLDENDRYLLLADFMAYCATKQRALDDFRDVAGWQRKALANIAQMGRFSSDRTVKDYAGGIWGLAPVR